LVKIEGKKCLLFIYIQGRRENQWSPLVHIQPADLIWFYYILHFVVPQISVPDNATLSENQIIAVIKLDFFE